MVIFFFCFRFYKWRTLYLWCSIFYCLLSSIDYKVVICLTFKNVIELSGRVIGKRKTDNVFLFETKKKKKVVPSIPIRDTFPRAHVLQELCFAKYDFRLKHNGCTTSSQWIAGTSRPLVSNVFALSPRAFYVFPRAHLYSRLVRAVPNGARVLKLKLRREARVLYTPSGAYHGFVLRSARTMSRIL